MVTFELFTLHKWVKWCKQLKWYHEHVWNAK